MVCELELANDEVKKTRYIVLWDDGCDGVAALYKRTPTLVWGLSYLHVMTQLPYTITGNVFSNLQEIAGHRKLMENKKKRFVVIGNPFFDYKLLSRVWLLCRGAVFQSKNRQLQCDFQNRIRTSQQPSDTDIHLSAASQRTSYVNSDKAIPRLSQELDIGHENCYLF